LAILKPDLTSLATSSYCGSTLAGPAVLQTNGNYTLRLDPNGSATGTATVTLFAVPADVTGSLTVNAAATPVSLTGPGQIATFTFAGSAGQAVTVRVTNNSMGSTKVSLRRPDGTNLMYSTQSGANFNLATMTLATPGTYSVVVDPELANTGSLSVQVTSP
jgi:pre-peptidase